MSKKIVDYTKTQIYKLKHKEDNDDTNIYIGSTTDFNMRKRKHKSDCNCIRSKGYNDKKYQYIRNNGGWDQWEMVWIQNYPCNSKREAEAKEDEIMCFYNAKLNSNRAFITEEQRKKRHSDYHKENRDRILKQKKIYYENNKNKKKDYYENNKVRILQYRKEYYKNKKLRINPINN
jgi:hypothetical protein